MKRTQILLLAAAVLLLAGTAAQGRLRQCDWRWSGKTGGDSDLEDMESS